MADRSLTRRSFLQHTSATAAGLVAARAATAGAGPSRRGPGDPIRLGLVGCGGRGSGAVTDSLRASEATRLVAMGDVFRHKAEDSRKNLRESQWGDRVDVPDERCFDGLDAFRRVIRHPDVDVVILATPPGFRPQHLAEIVDVGKHAFIEKPVCVDPTGYRSVMESAKTAREKGLSIAAGTQFRRSNNYLDAIRAIHEGAIGDPLFAKARYCVGGIWYRDREEGASDAEYQMDNWYHFLWTCGDQIVEQAVHNIDAINWAMGGPPAKAFGSGGQRCRPADSEIYDSMAVDFEYPNGVTVSFRCRQHPGANDISNEIVGTHGVAVIMPFGVSTITSHAGYPVLQTRYEGNAYVTEHAHLVESIQSGEPLCEIEEVADSSLTAVLGRMAAYTGEEVEWDFATRESSLDTFPHDLTLATSFEPRPVPAPDRTKLV